MIWSIVYIAVVLVANYTAVWFIPLPIFGLVSVGTLAFGITFTARDYAHSLGRKYVYVMIAVAALGSAVMSALGSVGWRIVLASSLAIILSETADTEIYQRLMSRRWVVRVAGSNAVSVPLDSLSFNLVAFAGVFAMPVIASIVFGEIVAKSITGSLTALWRLLS